MPAEDAEAIRGVLAEDDAVPIEEHRFVVWFDDWVTKGVEVTKTREEVIAAIETVSAPSRSTTGSASCTARPG